MIFVLLHSIIQISRELLQRRIYLLSVPNSYSNQDTTSLTVKCDYMIKCKQSILMSSYVTPLTKTNTHTNSLITRACFSHKLLLNNPSCLCGQKQVNRATR